MEYELKHGEAVAIGMKIAFKLALSKGYIKKDYYDYFVGLIDKYDLEFDFETVVVKRLVEVIKKEAFKLALSKGYIKKDYYDYFVGLIDKYDLEFDFETVVVKRLVEVIKKDKKNSFGDISVILPDASSCVGIFKMTSDEIEELLKKEFNFM